ncbi:MAG: site-2 protease family protein [Acidobacteria bacterium]|nr:site-2 protease family protein [Acidobacteriota bacterium]
MFELLAFALPPKVVNLGFALLGIGALIFLHELGHFLAAKYMGMPVETFSIGFGKRLMGFQWKETDVRLSVLPLGGYVKLAGFNPEDPGADDPHGFLQQPYWKRMLFYSGGILANLAVAFVLFGIVGVNQARVTKSRDSVVAVVTEGAASKGGLRSGDELVAVGPHAIELATVEQVFLKTLVPYIQSHAGQPIPFKIRRGEEQLSLDLTPAVEGGVGKLGFWYDINQIPLERRSVALADLAFGARYSGQRIVGLSGLVFRFLKKVVTFKATSGEVGGPITITRQMSQFAGMGLDPFLMICAAISLQLAILNALPIPMLDGGHMLILTAERIRRRDFSMEFKEKVLTGGFFLLAGLMGLVLIMDLFKLRK